MDERHRITTRLFMGILITSEVKMHLQNNPLWKNALAMPSKEHLIEVRRAKKNYIGSYLTEEGLNLQDLKNWQCALLSKIATYLPLLSIPSDACVIFPQLFMQ